jgi:Ca2+:H+ antiporter
MIFGALLLFVPLSLALKHLFGASALIVFATSAVGIAALAEWVRRATDQLADRVGPAMGGLLAVSFGSVAELVLALFVLMRGQADVVQAQITGSILATSLFGLGLAIIIGGATRERQQFSPERAGLLASLLILVVIALLLPAVFDVTGRVSGNATRLKVTDEEVSLGASVVLLTLYVANLIYTLFTHRDVFSAERAEREATWSLFISLSVLIVATVAIALESELISGSLQQTAGTLHLTPMFLGVIVLAVIGTAGDLFAASWFAHQNRMGLVLQICIGSAIQVALVVAPLLVLMSWLIGHPMTLVFSNPLHLFAIASTAFIVNSVARDGETTWFEGILLIGVYGLFGLAFFFSGTGG